MNCHNCNKSIERGIKFCPNCGQKNTDRKVSIWTYITEFFNLLFNVEGKLFTTIRDLFVPGKLTVAYFKGKRISYFHPLRFFIVMAALYLAAISFTSKDGYVSDDWTNNVIESTKIKIGNKLDSLNESNYKMQVYDSIAYQSIENFKDNIVGTTYNQTVYTKDGKVIYTVGNQIVNGKILTADNILYNFTGDSINIKVSDIIKFSPKELVKKYNIQGFWSKLIFQQYIKTFKGFDGVIKFFISNSIWMVLFMMPFFAFILKLFYIKKNKYYIEHLVFSLHSHAFIFLIASIIIFIHYFSNALPLFFITISLVVVYCLFALKNYYKQSWKWTILKFFGISFCYSFLALLFFTIGAITSLLLF